MSVENPVTDDELAAHVYSLAADSIELIYANHNVHTMFRAGLERAAHECRELPEKALEGKA